MIFELVKNVRLTVSFLNNKHSSRNTMLTEEVPVETFASQIRGTIRSTDPGFDNNRVESD
jgi:hypothetical protein